MPPNTMDTQSDPQQIHSYEEKDRLYYSLIRRDILDLIPIGTMRLLDVGCGMGDTGLAAKQSVGVREVVGVELFEVAAEAAKSKLDHVIIGDIEQLGLDYPHGYFDCILCADVLEHTRDPWGVLRKLRDFLDDDGLLIASIPNVRHIVPLLKIVFDRLEYEESGILDKTHLRFFTLHTIRQMFQQTGYTIFRIRTNRSKSWKFKLLNIFSFGIMRQFSVYQYIILARKVLPA
jgi:2-polyprenyl-3-methyl-5-hydroxy-6-metoxy-1,4-benzoquinol methylase